MFTVSVRAATPSKCQDGICVRGEGCDTPSVIVAATMFYNARLVTHYVIRKLE
jgi:hypothetical protein